MDMYCRKLVLVLAGLLLVCISCSTGSSGDVLSLNASLNGQDLAESSASSPVIVSSDGPAELSLDIENTSDAIATVEHVRLEGQLLDFVFLTYDTGVNEPIPAGGSRQFSFPIDFFDLDGQANGLLRGSVQLFDADREVLGSQELVLDARGNSTSTMSMFNVLLAIGAITVLIWNLVRMAQRSLPRNRFVRGIRFAYSGTAAGLAISAAFSTLRVTPLSTFPWVMITLVAAGIGFALGYVAPGGALDEDELDDDLDDLDEFVGEVDGDERFPATKVDA